jgi:hypothetical protein
VSFLHLFSKFNRQKFYELKVFLRTHDNFDFSCVWFFRLLYPKVMLKDLFIFNDPFQSNEWSSGTSGIFVHHSSRGSDVDLPAADNKTFSFSHSSDSFTFSFDDIQTHTIASTLTQIFQHTHSAISLANISPS